MGSDRTIPVGVSGRHVHVTQQDLETLFGPGCHLSCFKDLSQPGQFAANETVTLVGPKGIIPKVRILGPVRKATQVEISRTDGFTLGIDAPVRESGDLDGTPGIVIVGPHGPLKLEQGVIVAKRHIHFSPETAREFGVSEGEAVMVRTSGPRALIFDEVVVRVREDFALDMHVDTDEANAAGLKQGDFVMLVSAAEKQALSSPPDRSQAVYAVRPHPCCNERGRPHAAEAVRCRLW